MNDLVANPFGDQKSSSFDTVGSRQLQARENTEVMAMAMMAKRFPRDVIKCVDNIRNAFTRVTLAERAQYQFARGGSDIVGPSIRAAEAMSQQWGNMSNGWREVSRSVGPDGVSMSEVEAFSVDYESTSRESIQFVVRHWRDTKKGGYALKDERDIYELCANQAQRRKRACILAQIPGDITEMAMDQAVVTLNTSADTSAEGIAKIVATFASIGVTREQLEKRIQRKLDSIQPAQVVGLKRIYASLRDEISSPGDWFEVEADAPVAAGLEAVRAAAAAKKAKGKSAKPTAASQADAQTGETTPPNVETNAEAEAEVAVVADAATMSRLQAGIFKASDAETAALVLDEARGLVGPDQHETLATIYKARWGAS